MAETVKAELQFVSTVHHVEVREELASTRVELAIVRRDFATVLIHLGRVLPGRYRLALGDCWIPDEVHALLVAHKAHPLGQCSRCQKRAPLKDGVCSWTCTGSEGTEVTA